MRVVGSVGFSSVPGAGLGASRSLVTVIASFVFLGLGLGLGLGAGCYSPSPAPGLPCTADRECPDGQVCSPNEVCVASGSVHAIHDDDETDFDEPGTIFEGTYVSRHGTVESAPWMSHGMHVTSIARAAFDNAATASWDELADEDPAGEGYVYTTFAGWSDTPPPGLGLTRTTDITLLLEGEIFLDVGNWKLELRCDDLGFFDVAEPGSTEFRRLVSINNGTASLEVKVAGWYPVRAAAVNRTAGGSINLRGILGNGVTATFDAARLRAAVPATATGLVVDSFDSPALLHFRSAMMSGDLDNLAYGSAPPPDSGISTATAYSRRWSGQFYLEEVLNGFTLATEGGGHRLWIDGELRTDKLTASAATTTLAGLDLQPGWHDLVLDLDKRSTGSTTLRISDLAGDQRAFDAENLRPVVAPAQRWMSVRSTTSTPIPEPPATLARTLFLPTIAGTVTSAVAELAIAHDDHSELSISARWGAVTRTLAAAGTLTGNGFTRLRYTLNPRDYNLTPGGSWVLTVADNTAMAGVGDLNEVSATMSYIDSSPSAPPFPMAATYISSPRDLDDDVVAFGKASWKLRHDRGGVTVEVSLRTGATKEECALAPWQPVNAEGLVTTTPSRFVQYRVVMRTSGLIAAALDSFTLEYYSKD